MIKQFTANYAYTNSNFVIQNLPGASQPVPSPYIPVFCILKNLLQRGTLAQLAGGHTGVPTQLSRYLQTELGELHTLDDYKTPFWLIATEPPVWHQTIKGDVSRDDFPAREFFDALPHLLGEYEFVQQLILPEVPLSDIVATAPDTNEFAQQQVDFYCPPAKLVIEIDGYQHRGIQKVQDTRRDGWLANHGVQTIRINTADWRQQTPAFQTQLDQIAARLAVKQSALRAYEAQFKQLRRGEPTNDDIAHKLLPTAVLRFQLLVLELLIGGRLSLQDDHWQFCVFDADGLVDRFSDYGRFTTLALKDLFSWLEPLCRLTGLPFAQPALLPARPTTTASYVSGAMSVNFSLLKRYTDAHQLQPEVIFVRTDYFSATRELDGKNYFRVATAEPITYRLDNSDQTRETLRFFLQNLFGKDDFREGQLPIILNALNRTDTVGLLPTGGGKSLCYQLPCLLQPAVSFAVCPIKSLMYDQKDNLNRAAVTQTNYITGELEPSEKEAIQREFAEGRYFLIWISPERFQQQAFRDYLATLQGRHVPVAYAVIDEVHCMSEWGHDFRTSYLNLTRTIRRCCPAATFLGLTATASVNVLRDIRIEFGRAGQPLADEAIKTKLDFTRPELHFTVVKDDGKKQNELVDHLRELQRTDRFLSSSDRAGLIFTPHRNGRYGCYSLSNELNRQFARRVNWFSGSCPTTRTTDGRVKDVLSPDEFERHKQNTQKEYKENKFPLMVATKAFGMGVDKQNIHYTFHYGLPGSVESLYQEAGRAGRWDPRQSVNAAKQAQCRVLFTDETLEPELLDELFHPATQLPRILEILAIPRQPQSTYKEGDVLRQLYLFTTGQGSIDEEAGIMLALLREALTPANQPAVAVFWEKSAGRPRQGVVMPYKQMALEKAVYRLSLLGVVQDWTTDFVSHLRIEFGEYTDASVCDTLINHLLKYRKDDAEDTRMLRQTIEAAPGATLLEKCVRYLLDWTWKNIAYYRRQSLKDLRELCLNYKDSTSFKQTIDNVFRINEFTIVIQYISDQPRAFSQWIKAFETKTGTVAFDRAEFTARCDNLTRFLPSNLENLGLDTVSGLLRLALDEYENTDGRARLERTLSRLPDYFDSDEQQKILETIVNIVRRLNLPIESRYELTHSIRRYYAGDTDWMYDELNLLNAPKLAHIAGRLQALNQKLYDGLSKVR